MLSLKLAYEFLNRDTGAVRQCLVARIVMKRRNPRATLHRPSGMDTNIPKRLRNWRSH